MSRSVSSHRKILVIEDDAGLQKQFKWCLSDYEVIVAGDRSQALAELRRHEPAVVTLDLGLPPDAANATEGLAALGEILELAPRTKVIVITGNDDRTNAVVAVGRGAYDFYQKPIDPEVLSLVVDRAFRLYDLEEENRRLIDAQVSSPLEGIIAGSPEMLEVCRSVEKIAPTGATVLLLGESGTGKELLARALHNLSPRNENRFVAINCAAIPETLLESELFGYEKGAFTGASKQTLGKIEYANSGTLFLDEVGDLPQALQAKLLRFLQERVIERVGGRQEVPVDVRILCATHKDLRELIKDGRFREDLYYRISEITINIPPVRDRTGDAIVLARALLRHFLSEQGSPVRNFSDEAIQAIEAYPWPGNAREMENRIKRAVIMAEGTLISAADLELPVDGVAAEPLNLKEVRDSAERDAIRRALNRCAGKIAQAAELLGVSRPTLYDLMNKHDIKQPVAEQR